MNSQYIEAGKTLLKVFIAACLGQFIVMGSSIFDVSTDGWKSIVSAGVAAAVLTGYNWLNPNDPRYGRGSSYAE